MKIYRELNLNDFEAWSGAVETKNTIIENNKEEDFKCLMEDFFPNGATETQLNDMLWFESEYIYECLGI